MMKKYLGSHMNVYGAVVAPLFVILPLLFAAWIGFTAEISGATVFLICMCCCSVIWLFYIKKEVLQFYAWGTFEQTCVRIYSPFTSEIILEYEKCKDVGIGSYTHGILNSQVGSKIYFIYLSYERLDEKYRHNINLWKPNARRIKVRFTNELYTYLLSTLSEKKLKCWNKVIIILR